MAREIYLLHLFAFHLPVMRTINMLQEHHDIMANVMVLIFTNIRL